MAHHHLIPEEREIIAYLHKAGRTQAEIAGKHHRAASTISRELWRNRSRNGYWAVAAQKKAETRHHQRPRVGKLQQPEVRCYVQERLRQHWSPDEIAWRSRKDFPGDRRRQVSHQTIYVWMRVQETLTLDNGKEFAEHRQLAAEAALKVFFALPYCAWQRGTNERNRSRPGEQ